MVGNAKISPGKTKSFAIGRLPHSGKVISRARKGSACGLLNLIKRGLLK